MLYSAFPLVLLNNPSPSTLASSLPFPSLQNKRENKKEAMFRSSSTSPISCELFSACRPLVLLSLSGSVSFLRCSSRCSIQYILRASELACVVCGREGVVHGSARQLLLSPRCRIHSLNFRTRTCFHPGHNFFLFYSVSKEVLLFVAAPAPLLSVTSSSSYLPPVQSAFLYTARDLIASAQLVPHCYIHFL